MADSFGQDDQIVTPARQADTFGDGDQIVTPAKGKAPAASAGLIDRILMQLMAAEQEINRGLATGKKPGPVPPLPSQEEADAAKAARGDQSIPAAYGRGALQGALFGFGDEAIAGARAMAGEDYATAVEDERQKLAALRKANPGLATAAQLGGMAPHQIAPLGWVFRGAQGPMSFAARSGALGGGFAFAQGVGEGEGGVGDRFGSGMRAVGDYATSPLGLPLAAGLGYGGYQLARAGQAINPLAQDATGMGALVARNAEVDAQRLGQRLRTAEAFQESGIRPVGPVLSEGPAASVGRQLADTVVVGQPMRTAITDAYQGARAAGERLADSMSTLRTPAEAGVEMQRGLDAARTARISELPPQTLRGMNIEPFAPMPIPQQTSEAAQRLAREAEAARTAAGADGRALSIRGRDVGNVTPREQQMTMRRGPADMSEAELTRIAQRPARDTSFSARQEALYELAHNKLPPIMRSDGSRNPNLVPTRHSAAVIGQILRQEQAAGISGGVAEGGRFGRLAEQLRNNNRNFTLESLRAARTEVGRSLASFGEYDARLDRVQLKQLYGALSRDMEAAYTTLAQRAWRQTTVSNNQRDHVTADVARRADRALYEFRRADRYTRVGLERMERFMSILDARNPEAAVMRLTSAALDRGRGNINLISAARSVLQPEQWREVSGVVLRQMWRPNPSARGYVAETGFSPQTFTTNWERMSPQARRMFFGASRELDNFVLAARAMAEFEATVNGSRTATNLINSGLGVGAVAGLMTNPIKTVAAVLGGYTASLLLASPQYARLVTAVTRAKLAIAQAVVAGRRPPDQTELTRQLEAAARRDPELAQAFALLSAELVAIKRANKDKRR